MIFVGNIPDSVCNKLVYSFRYVVYHMHGYHDIKIGKVF